jgi:ribosomal protein S18 acetylase RimI-like enzyme
MHHLSVRFATIDDAGRIADIHVRAWQAAYRNIIPDKVLSTLSVESRTQSWLQQITGDVVTVLVAEIEAQLCGWIAFGQSRDADTPLAAEVYAIYLEPNLVRRGIGRTLWAEALKRLTAAGDELVLVWVLEANAPARRFYEAMGGQIDGKKTIKIADVDLEEVRYRFASLHAGQRL